MLQSRWSQNVFVGIIAVVLLALVIWGYMSGIQAARSKMVLKDAKAIAAGVEHFKADQNRYPTTTEFDNNSLMRLYISNFPPQRFLSELCEKNLEYVNPNARTYELRVCLPKGVDGYRAGWNVYHQ